MRILRRRYAVMLLPLLAATLSSCNTVDDDRIPSMPVQINLSTPDLWSTYGVFGFGQSRCFIRQLGQPSNFAYTASSATGFGGVLLVSGFNPYTLESGVPMAYDLACPVECKSDIRVRMEAGDGIPDAVCPDCGSHYDVTEMGGAPTQGPAYQMKVGLTRYECLATTYGGYIISSI